MQVFATAGTMAAARAVAAAVTDPEMPMLTLADLGVLRDVRQNSDGRITVDITPTYSGCPAMATMRADLLRHLSRAGFDDVDVRTVLSPAWSSDWISAEGRRKLAAAGISPPHRAVADSDGSIPISLIPRTQVIPCPQCGSTNTERTSEFGATACKSLHRCLACAEPFDHVKEI